MTDAERIAALEAENMALMEALQEAIDALGALNVEVALGTIEVEGGSRIWRTDELSAKWKRLLQIVEPGP